MDRNSVIGFVLLGALLIGYIFWNQQSTNTAKLEKARQDSIANLNKPKEEQAKVIDSTGGNIVLDSARLQSEYGPFAAAASGTEQQQVLENKLVKITFSNKGGEPRTIQLLDFKTSDGKPLFLQQGSFNRTGLKIPLANNQSLNTSDAYFAPQPVQKNADGSQTISYRLGTSANQYLEYVYTLKADSYLVDYTINLIGMQNVLPKGNINFQWNSQADRQEHNMEQERLNNQIHYRFANKDHDYFTLTNRSQEKLDKPIQWISFKQQFFNITLLARKENFASAEINTKVPESGNIVGQNMTTLAIPYNGAAAYSFPMEVYYGPNHYQTLKRMDVDLEKIIPLGSGIFAFVKYVNKWIIIPVFNFLGSLTSNYGLIILLLTIFIRLIIAPFTYQSYVSAAKMKVLKPELDELRAKYKDDQQSFGVEQMKLFRSAGVNPLGGCLPALMQLPILVAMYSFFPSSIELRQESFLWAKDLSTYDSIYTFGFNIPFYGDHISLFTILMTITSLILAFYNRGMTDQSNPVMKYMPYVFPVMLLGIFNKLAAALTYYYFLSNVISILLQWVIQTFVINHDKIHAKIQANKSKPKTQSKWAAKLEEMQKRQQEIQKTPKKK
ncbi:membrane protein insertase YidC [Chitinophaga niabensis]|uniref:Membrane protein insertase YidC n=1 Tax=Chitinophaga niabensis TaxID=536979 RepID=A0A1N6KCU7_9BACT|nr:membrane protein insertase YidC [Chitinophaga niabensis]SIO54273.1 YidC/Oxa1 family membrane protein insertase [Chitinophaga niabensis]